MRSKCKALRLLTILAAVYGFAVTGVAHSAEHNPEHLLAPRLEWWDAWQRRTHEAPPPFSKMKSYAGLPPLLEFADGRKVRSNADWQQRRGELRKLLCRWIVGSLPEKTPQVTKADVIDEQKLDGASRRIVRIGYGTNTPTLEAAQVTVELLIPDHRGPRPVFMTQTHHRRMSLIGLARGYVVCIYPGGDTDDQSDQFARAYPEADWGRIARRAWLASRVLDYLVTLPEVDKDKIAIAGHSRNGKQSMIAAAYDERIGAVISISSGTGGATPFRYVSEDAFEESVEFMSRQPPTADWFSPRIRYFTGREDKLPVDVHAYLALIAPRHCLLSTAYNDGVETTFAVEQDYLAGREVYQYLKRPDALAIHWRPGGHEFDTADAETYFDWFDFAFGRGGKPMPVRPLHHFDWQAWKKWQTLAQLTPPNSRNPREQIEWMLGDAPAHVPEPGGQLYDVETPHESAMMARDAGVTGDIVRTPLNFGSNVRGHLYQKRGQSKSMPCVIWLHPYSYSSGYGGAYMIGPRLWEALPREGIAVFAFDQIGFGRRLLEGADFYARHPKWSKLGKMVEDVRSAVDLLSGSVGRSPGGDGFQSLPVDPKRIYVVGYSLGGMVALYSAALDKRIAGAASFCGFTPMRTDTQERPDGGLRRLWELHSLAPRLGLFQNREAQLPYDYDDVLRLIAPRPCLVVAPLHDRMANSAEVAQCVARASKSWPMDRRRELIFDEPDDYNRFQGEQVEAVRRWLKTVTVPRQ